MITKCDNWVLNFECKNCGVGIFNATKYPKICPFCGNTKFVIIHEIKKGDVEDEN